jgi:hypothetical protein
VTERTVLFNSKLRSGEIIGEHRRARKI